jgi:hypothetical protein
MQISVNEKIFVGLIAVAVVVLGNMFLTTDADARREALDSMCGSYGGATGGVVDVLPMWIENQSGFYVKCDNVVGDTWTDRFGYIVINESGKVY